MGWFSTEKWQCAETTATSQFLQLSQLNCNHICCRWSRVKPVKSIRDWNISNCWWHVIGLVWHGFIGSFDRQGWVKISMCYCEGPIDQLLMTLSLGCVSMFLPQPFSDGMTWFHFIFWQANMSENLKEKRYRYTRYSQAPQMTKSRLRNLTRD